MADNPQTILLIEDDDSHAELIQRAFEDYAETFSVMRAHSLMEARSAMQANSLNLIIADWRLPDGESLQLLPTSFDEAAIPIVLMTSYGNERVAVEALKSGALDYVVKSPEFLMDMPHVAERAISQWNARMERAFMQKALLESEAQFRLLAENASDMIARLSVEGVFLYVSPASRAILGYSPEELVGKKILQLVHPDEMLFADQLLVNSDIKTETRMAIYRARHKQGHYVWLETSARSILDEKTDSVIEIQSSSRDITQRKRAEEALQSAHYELREAYERTIEGWVRALDMRDRETEGHTQRVTELTVKFARILGVTENELVHIRRGALLHDMGKMAIRNEILQKPGPLTEEEQQEMRKHPMYAYEMLSPIAYLRPALDIPYCHHECWDGSGYPRGLKGEGIPLTARIFAIVDVWDALTRDRPYRKRMPQDEVLAYVRKKAGTLFEPRLVDIFINMIQEMDEEQE